MSKSNTYEQQVLALLLNGTAIANVADDAASSPLSQVWVGLHENDPGEAGTQGTNETTYTGYSRVAVTRSTAGFVISTGGASGASASPVANIDFPEATSTSTGTITHFSIGRTSAASTGDIFYKGTISPNINYGQNVTPRLTTASSIRED